ncbi:MAG: cytochrome b [Gammaproteobacteria bacterium]|nr:MAG: cytochrome b [Gammaproteobacteria bacterium]
MQPTAYTRTAIALHWLIAALIFTTFPLGVYMHELPLSPTRVELYSYHKWIGVTILLLAVIRVAWRASHPAPPPVAGTPAWQRITAAATHHLLYLLVIIIPVSGWLMSSAKGVPTVWLGLVPLPDLVGKNEDLGELLEEVHETLNFLLLLLVVVHLVGALKHRFIDRDEVMARMLPFLGSRKL